MLILGFVTPLPEGLPTVGLHRVEDSCDRLGLGVDVPPETPEWHRLWLLLCVPHTLGPSFPTLSTISRTAVVPLLFTGLHQLETQFSTYLL